MNTVPNYVGVGASSFVLMLLAAYVLPALALVLTPPKASRSITGLISLVLNAASGLLTEAAGAKNFNWAHGGLLALLSLLVAVMANRQLWAGDFATWLHKLWPGSNADAIVDMGAGITDELEAYYGAGTGAHQLAPPQAPVSGTTTTPDAPATPVASDSTR